MAILGFTPCPMGVFVDRRSRDGLNLAGRRKLAGFEDPLHRRLARDGGYLALGDGGVVEVLEVEDVDRAGGALDLVEGVGQPGRNGRAYQVQRLVHGTGAAHHEGPALLVHGLVEKGLGGDLRSDSRRVTHRDGDEGFLSPGCALRCVGQGHLQSRRPRSFKMRLGAAARLAPVGSASRRCDALAAIQEGPITIIIRSGDSKNEAWRG